MIKNYLKIAWRNLWNNKLFSFINIVGLAVGVTCCVLIFLYVQNELSYDKFNDKADRIYRVASKIIQENKEETFAPTSPITSQKIQAAFPEVQKIVRFTFSRRPVAYNEKRFYDTKILFADSTLLDIFSFPLIEGNAQKALNAPYTIIVTEKIAKKYFGNEPALGKMLKFSDTLSVMVTGVMKDIPLNSHINFDCVISRSTLLDMNKGIPDWIEGNETNWLNCDSYAYLLLKNTVDPKVFEKKVNKFLLKETAELKKEIGMQMNVVLQPITDIHLRSHLEHEYPGTNSNSDIKYVYIFSATAILILLIACCNFINLSTARSLNRSKEIGLRKVIGAMRGQLIAQFLGESILFSIISSVLSLLLVLLFIPLFNSFIGTTLGLNLSVVWIYLAIICSVGFLAGLYPALLMSSFSPIRSLKGKVSHGLMDILFRKGLVVFQFSIAIILIIGTTLILQQLDFMQNRNIDLNKEQVLAIELKGIPPQKGNVLIEELKKNPKVVSTSLNNFSFKGVPNITVLPEGFAQNELSSCPVISVDENFFNTMQIKVIEGRNFSKDFPTDVNEAFIVNEAAVKDFRWKTPKQAIGKKVDWAFGKSGKIIGVVKDFNFASMRENVKPMLIHIFPQWHGLVTVRLKTEDLSSTMKTIEASWKTVAGDAPFKSSFLEEDFNSLYKSEQNMRSVLGAFTFLSVLVACLGLFGLAAFTIKQRFREIGIRKVLGSSVRDIVRLLSKDFLKLVIISILIAAPIAWYAMHKWLQDFAYKIDISWWVFLLAGFLAVVIAFVTVSFQAIKAAIANPIKSLRTE
ncbi:MAG: ABC transporter permease [Bacteroidia bacterium]